MQVIACHPSQVDEIVDVVAKAQAVSLSTPPDSFVSIEGWCIKGADSIEDVVADETLDLGVVEVREVAA